MKIRSLLTNVSTHTQKPQLKRTSQLFFSTKTSPAGELVKKLTAEKSKIAVIPSDLHTKQLKSISQTVYAQRIARLGGILLYPSLSLMSGSIVPFLIGTPFCVSQHHLAIKRACGAAGDLVLRQQIFDDEKANLQLKNWMGENDITKLSFTLNKELLLFSEDQAPTLSALARLDQTSINNQPRVILSLGSKLPELSKRSISYFHLAEDIREQVTLLIKARSRRFRTPVFLGAAGYAVGHLPHGIPETSLIVGAAIGFLSNHHTVSSDTEKLWSLINKKKNLSELIAPEFRDRYAHISTLNSDLKLMINIFGDVVVNPKLPLRSTASFFFPVDSAGNESTNAEVNQQKNSIP